MTGARTARGGPADDLLLAYRGTAYFLRALSQLTEHDYDEPGDPAATDTRRRTIATVGYDARSWAQLTEAIREGHPDPSGFDDAERDEAIALGATLPPRALRHLVEHSATHLRVEWRDLPADRWHRTGRAAGNPPRPVTDLPLLRARQTWLAAVDLGTGASFTDFPPALVHTLLIHADADVHTSGEEVTAFQDGVTATGAAVGVARWLWRGDDRCVTITAAA